VLKVLMPKLYWVSAALSFLPVAVVDNAAAAAAAGVRRLYEEVVVEAATLARLCTPPAW
jgi:hypothetical protein